MDNAEAWQLTLKAAEHYARYSRYLLEPWVSMLLESVDLKPGEQVLDVACGTGFVTRQAILAVGASGSVTGIDINEGMLAIAKESSGNSAFSNIHWRKADACSMPFPKDSFDVALCQQGLQFFPDREGALHEIRRILTSVGRIGLSVWGSLTENPYFQAIDDIVCRHLNEAAAVKLRTPHTLAYPETIYGLLQNVGFHNISIQKVENTLCTPPAREFLPNHLNAMPVAGKINKLPKATRSALFEDLLISLNPYLEGDCLRIPATVLVATAFH